MPDLTKTTSVLATALLVVMAAAACGPKAGTNGAAVPAGYLGGWRAETGSAIITLVFTDENLVSYERTHPTQQPNATGRTVGGTETLLHNQHAYTSFTAKVTRFTSSSFQAGGERFQIQRQPFEDGGQRKVVIDGVEMTWFDPQAGFSDTHRGKTFRQMQEEGHFPAFTPPPLTQPFQP